MFLQERTRSCQTCCTNNVVWYTWMYHTDEITKTLCYINRNCDYLWIELSGWKGSVTYGLGADLSLPQCPSVTTGIWTLTHKSDLRAEISGSIVWYDALAQRPEVLLSWFSVCACAVSLELKFIPHSWKNVFALFWNNALLDVWPVFNYQRGIARFDT